MSVECPYCEFENDEPEGLYKEGDICIEECENCDKTFGVTVSVSYDYSGHKMPCANGEDHDWQPITGWPSEHFKDRYQCSYCDEERVITKRKQFMNREIKFRAWNKKINKMVDLQKITPLATEIPGLFLPFSDDIVLMQYTGSKDKAEKEIYEGDIVKCPLSSESTAYLWQEAMEKGFDNFVLRLISIPAVYQERLPEDCEIIGNKFKNPELLVHLKRLI